MTAALLAPTKSLPKIELGLREIDLKYDWSLALHSYSHYGTFGELQKFLLSAKEMMLNSILPTAEMPDVHFNPEQQRVIDVVSDQITQILTPTNSVWRF